MHHQKNKSKGIKKNGLKQAFKNIIWPRRKMVLVGLLLIAINRASGLVLPASVKILIDDIIDKKPDSFLNQFSSNIGSDPHNWFVPFFIFLAIAVGIQSLTSYSLTRLLSVEAQNLISELRIKMQKHILKLPINFFDNTKSGELVSRIMVDAEGVRNLVGTGLVQLFGGVITAVASFIILLNLNPIMTALTLVPMIVFAFIAMKAFGSIRPIFRERGQINAEVTGRLTETLGGIRVVKGFGAEDFEIGIFEKGANRIFLNIKKSLTATSIVTSSATFLLGLTTIAIMWYGSTEILKQQMSTGEFFSFFFYVAFLIAPIVQMSNIGSQMTDAFAGLDRMDEILSLPVEGEEEERVLSLDNMKGDIEFRDVSFAYDEDNEVVHNVSFKVPSGEIVALVGSSGSGKSTIAGMAASFLSPSVGEIFVDGNKMSEVKLGDYRKNLGLVLQDNFLFEGTIRENILFAKQNANEAEFDAAVKTAYVHEFTDRFEKGLDTMIGERGVKLSGGQKQRVAIARAILANPRVLILDEATSNLDTESEVMIQRSLETLIKDRTTIVIAHRLSTIRKAHQILVIEKGNVVERGTHDDLIQKEGRYFELYTYQSRI